MYLQRSSACCGKFPVDLRVPFPFQPLEPNILAKWKALLMFTLHYTTVIRQVQSQALPRASMTNRCTQAQADFFFFSVSHFLVYTHLYWYLFLLLVCVCAARVSNQSTFIFFFVSFQSGVKVQAPYYVHEYSVNYPLSSKNWVAGITLSFLRLVPQIQIDLNWMDFPRGLVALNCPFPHLP